MLRDDSGVTLLEYALLCGVIGIVVIAACALLGTAVALVFCEVASFLIPSAHACGAS